MAVQPRIIGLLLSRATIADTTPQNIRKRPSFHMRVIRKHPKINHLVKVKSNLSFGRSDLSFGQGKIQLVIWPIGLVIWAR